MASRASMAWLIRELRRKINDVGPGELDDDENYTGDSIKLTCTYHNLDGSATDPTDPAISIWDSEGTLRVDGATPTASGPTGELHYNYRIPEAGPEGVWRVEFTGTVDGQIREYAKEFKAVTTKRIWTDDELQTYLDMHRIHVRRELLMKDVDGKVYWSGYGALEDDVTLWDSSSANATEVSSSGYTADLVDGTFTFGEKQNSDCYLDGKAHNLHAAIAEAMEQLAMDQNKAIRWERGGVRYTQYDLLELARYHRSLSGARSTTIIKSYRVR